MRFGLLHRRSFEYFGGAGSSETAIRVSRGCGVTGFLSHRSNSWKHIHSNAPTPSKDWYSWLSMAKRKSQKTASLFDVDVDTSGPSGPSDDHVALHEAAQT